MGKLKLGIVMVVLLSVSCLAMAAGPPPGGAGFKKAELDPGFYWFQHQFANSYLIVGKEAAVLIDTGYGAVDYYEICRSITNLPLSVVVTHGHYDHTGGVHQFPKEWVKRLKAGEVNTFGDIKLEVIATPGHTPSSVCLLDRERGLLFVGDTINPHEIWLQLIESDLEQWLDSIDKLATLYPDVRRVLTGHGPFFTGEVLKEAERIAKDIRSGRAKLNPEKKQYESSSFVIKVK